MSDRPVSVVETGSEDQTQALARELASRLRGGDVVHLSGDLGAGKTRFVKGLAEGLGLDPDDVRSPTFAFVDVHRAAPGKLGLVHVDLYRVSDASELSELGLEELPGPDAVAAIEWADRLPAGPPPRVTVTIEDLGGDRRRITVDPPLATPPRSVVMVLQSFHPVVGGAERQALQLSRVLMARGIAVRVVTRRLPGTARRETLDGLPVARLAAWGSGAVGTSVFAASGFLHLLLHARDAGVIHVHLAASHAVAAALAGRLTGTPVVVKLGGAIGLGEIGRARETLGGRLKLAALRALRPQLVALNDDHVAELKAAGLGELPVEIIPNGVDTERHHPATAAEKALLRRTLGLSGFVVLFAGRLADDKSQVKALGVFLDAWRAFLARTPDATFLIAGDGPETARFRQAIASRDLGSRVRMLGKRDDLPELYRAADAFVLLSKAEGMSNALLEAMASGLPLLAPRVSGVVGRIEDGRHGVLFDPWSPGEAGAALERLAADPVAAAEMGAECRRAAEGLSLHRTADLWIDLYARCAGGTR